MWLVTVPTQTELSEVKEKGKSKTFFETGFYSVALDGLKLTEICLLLPLCARIKGFTLPTWTKYLKTCQCQWLLRQKKSAHELRKDSVLVGSCQFDTNLEISGRAQS